MSESVGIQTQSITCEPCADGHHGLCNRDYCACSKHLHGMGIMAEMQDRLVRAAANLDDLCNKAAALHNTSEYSRLSGKREGVNLALSYLDEAVRERV